jgi:hypothetical protein
MYAIHTCVLCEIRMDTESVTVSDILWCIFYVYCLMWLCWGVCALVSSYYLFRAICVRQLVLYTIEIAGHLYGRGRWRRNYWGQWSCRVCRRSCLRMDGLLGHITHLFFTWISPVSAHIYLVISDPSHSEQLFSPQFFGDWMNCRYKQYMNKMKLCYSLQTDMLGYYIFREKLTINLINIIMVVKSFSKVSFAK